MTFQMRSKLAYVLVMPRRVVEYARRVLMGGPGGSERSDGDAGGSAKVRQLFEQYHARSQSRSFDRGGQSGAPAADNQHVRVLIPVRARHVCLSYLERPGW